MGGSETSYCCRARSKRSRGGRKRSPTWSSRLGFLFQSDSSCGRLSEVYAASLCLHSVTMSRRSCSPTTHVTLNIMNI